MRQCSVGNAVSMCTHAPLRLSDAKFHGVSREVVFVRAGRLSACLCMKIVGLSDGGYAAWHARVIACVRLRPAHAATGADCAGRPHIPCSTCRQSAVTAFLKADRTPRFLASEAHTGRRSSALRRSMLAKRAFCSPIASAKHCRRGSVPPASALRRVPAPIPYAGYLKYP
jgi:hypothetical protein